MKRSSFLKGISLAGVSLAIPRAAVAKQWRHPNNGCALVPSETAGPFPLDLTDNNFFFRTDVRESSLGVPYRLRIRVIGDDNCMPLQNVRVNIWHCDKDGVYSGYQTAVGETFLRGYQITDSNGEVEFITIFPGWYPGRVCHIHFQVFVSNNYAAISQFTFNNEQKNEILSNNQDLYVLGADPKTPATDGSFADGYNLQIVDVDPDPNNLDGVYSYYVVGVQGAGMVGVSNTERQTLAQVRLDQNQPNPFVAETLIPFELSLPAAVELTLFSIQGQQVATLFEGFLTAGAHSVLVNFSELGLATTNYAYQISVQNSNGSFKTLKLMTAKA